MHNVDSTKMQVTLMMRGDNMSTFNGHADILSIIRYASFSIRSQETNERQYTACSDAPISNQVNRTLSEWQVDKDIAIIKRANLDVSLITFISKASPGNTFRVSEWQLIAFRSGAITPQFNQTGVRRHYYSDGDGKGSPVWGERWICGSIVGKLDRHAPLLRSGPIAQDILFSGGDRLGGDKTSRRAQ